MTSPESIPRFNHVALSVSPELLSGDTAKDLPEADEGGPRVDAVGTRYFVLPNPMYGSWEHKVTVKR